MPQRKLYQDTQLNPKAESLKLIKKFIFTPTHDQCVELIAIRYKRGGEFCKILKKI